MKKIKDDKKIEKIEDDNKVNNIEEEQSEKNETHPEEKTKKSKKKLIIIISVSLILIIGIITSILLFTNKDDKKVSEKTEEKREDSNQENENEKKYKLKVYSSEYDENEICDGTNLSSCNKFAFDIPTKTENAKILAVAYDNYVLYLDEEIYLYNNDDKKTKEIPIDKEAEEYYISHLYDWENSKKEIYGISYSKDEKATYYNLKTDKIMYAGKYEEISAIDDDLLSATNSKFEEVTVSLLDAKEELNPYIEVEDTCAYYEKTVVGDDYYITINSGCTGGSTYSYYTKNYKKITDFIDGPLISINAKGNIVANESGNTINEYNIYGDKVNTYKSTGKVMSVHKDIYVEFKNNALYIKEYNGKEYKLRDWEKNNYYHSMISGYYDADSLDNENEKEAGYYFIVEYNEAGEGPGIEYYFNYDTKEIKSWELEEVGGYAKPVLYLYPEKKTEVVVDFEHKENLTTTYPKFNNDWTVTANPNGDLYDKNGKYYYGLYWEEKPNHRVNFQTGFYVTKDNAITFLEEKLTKIGLSDRERNEFIMYWLPILEKNGQSLVYFELTEERESYNKINISPQPDSLLRVAIHVKKVNKKINIKEQKITPFTRKGFTAVEWGGVLYN